MGGFRTAAAWLALGSTLVLAAGCGGGGGGGGGGSSTSVICTVPPSGGAAARDVLVSWMPNRETAVNSPGGGYRVYYCTTPGFDVATAPFVPVEYAGGPATPTSATIPDLPPGTYYIKVVAYSALSAPWGSGGSTSEPSAQVSVTVP